jgi:hypothetical protein
VEKPTHRPKPEGLNLHLFCPVPCKEARHPRALERHWWWMAVIRNPTTHRFASLTGHFDPNQKVFAIWAKNGPSTTARIMGGKIDQKLFLDIDQGSFTVATIFDDIDMFARHVFLNDLTPKAGKYTVMFFLA